MKKIVGIRFKKAGKIYYFDPQDIYVNVGDDVIVETARGVEFGVAVIGPKEVEEESLVSPLKPILRLATIDDKILYSENKAKAKECRKICEDKIIEHGLEMYLTDCEYTFDRNKLIFYFTADGRIDFRDLVKDLAAIFRTRIELRQIGVRDEAKLLGGLGPCGRKLCCSSWLGDFQPVSIKMAKDQSLSLNPSKISGVCGRLFCCLKYEYDNYAEALKHLPNPGSIVKTPNGNAEVVDVNPLVAQVKVRFEDSICEYFEVTEIKTIKKSKNYDHSKGEEHLDAHELKELKMLENE